jgi:hypothetical protein
MLAPVNSTKLQAAEVEPPSTPKDTDALTGAPAADVIISPLPLATALESVDNHVAAMQ